MDIFGEALDILMTADRTRARVVLYTWQTDRVVKTAFDWSFDVEGTKAAAEAINNGVEKSLPEGGLRAEVVTETVWSDAGLDAETLAEYFEKVANDNWTEAAELRDQAVEEGGSKSLETLAKSRELLAQRTKAAADVLKALVAHEKSRRNKQYGDETHCRHGVYVGTPGGADYMCGACEDGRL